MNNKILIGILVLATLLGGVLLLRKPQQLATTNSPTEQKEQVAGFGIITSAELAARLTQKVFFFVNVHVPYEGEIKNTDAFIPYDKIYDNLNKLPQDKSAKIVLYCRSGRMSELAARELAKLGYTEVSHLAGGMIDWEKNGYEIVKK